MTAVQTSSSNMFGFSQCRRCGLPGVGLDVKGLGPMHVAREEKRQAETRKYEEALAEDMSEGLDAPKSAVSPGRLFVHSSGNAEPAPTQTRDHTTESRVQFASGATMSELKPRYDLICPTGLRRLAERYALGAKKHGDLNWCLAGDKDDKAFMRARLNHLIRHVADYLLEGNSHDDNLAAIAWAAFALMHYEEGCKHHKHELP